jgi:dihydrofolate reductase
MGKVTFNISMSLDGFVAGPDGAVDRIFQWYFSGDTDLPFPGSDYVFKISKASAEHLQKETRKVGAIITGRRNFNFAGAWGGHPPLGVHHFVVTHTVPQEWANEGSMFTFVTDGVESAIRQARQKAGEKDVAISTPSILRQALEAGLVDEISIDLVAVLLGKGVRLFEEIGIEPVDLEIIKVVEGKDVTHLTYRVCKK